MKTLYKSGGISISQIMYSNNPLLLSNNNRCILVDTGVKEKCETILDRIEKALNGRHLQALIITHAHHDHVENVASIKEKFKAKVIAQKDEADYIQKGISSPLSPWNYAKGEKIIKCSLARWNFKPTEVDIWVEEQMSLSEYGMNAYLLCTPGHSCGDLSIIVNNEVAIVGDSLGGMKKRPFAKKIHIASERAVTSWETLIGLNLKKYITTHNVIIEYEDLIAMYENYKIEVDLLRKLS